MYDAQFFACVLCMLAHQLIRNRLLFQLNTLFDLTSNLFCDIVLFTTLCNKNKQKFLQKHKNIILTFYSLRDQFQQGASDNDYLYFMFSIFCSPSYIGHTSNIDKRRTSHTSCSLNIKPISFLYYKLHAIGIEHFTFCISKPPLIYAFHWKGSLFRGLNRLLTHRII